MPAERVLICGAGVSGSIAAFWLAKYGFEVVVIERSRKDQKLGQGIEIEEPALAVVREMGVLPQLNERKTGELGCEFMDQHGRKFGRLEVGALSPTGALELMRGDLTEVLYKAADSFDNVTYHFETTIRGLTQNVDKVTVDIEDRRNSSNQIEEFDFVIGADGVKSRTRQYAMGTPEQLDCYKPVGAYVAYFSIKKEDGDWPYSKICQFPGRRVMWIRPVSKESDITSVYLTHINSQNPTLSEANSSGDRDKQKQALAQVFSGKELGREATRVVNQMITAENFYSDELMQVKLKNWSKGRVVLVGDSAWAPTPFTGEGNQLAIIGAFVLAQEMNRHRNNTQLAFESYQTRFRAYVEKAQAIPLGGYAPYIVCPETELGVRFVRWCFYLLSWLAWIAAWTGLLKYLPDEHHDTFDLQISKEGDDKKVK